MILSIVHRAGANLLKNLMPLVTGVASARAFTRKETSFQDPEPRDNARSQSYIEVPLANSSATVLS